MSKLIFVFIASIVLLETPNFCFFVKASRNHQLRGSSVNNLSFIMDPVVVSNTPNVKNENEMKFETIEHGYHSGIKVGGNFVFQTKSRFEEFWKRHTSQVFPSPKAPAIDFKNDMVVVVMRGEQNKGGYGIEIESITESGTGDGILIHSKTADPCDGCITTQALTQPFHFVQMKKSQKNVKFETVAAAPDPPRFPTFILQFDDDELSDPSSVAGIMMENEFIESVQVLNGIKMIFVDFHKDMIDPCSAKKVLLDLVRETDDVEYLEADPLEQFWSAPCTATEKEMTSSGVIAQPTNTANDNKN